MNEVGIISSYPYIDIILPGMELFLEYNPGQFSANIFGSLMEGYNNVVFNATASTIVGISEKKRGGGRDRTRD
jgi:hypothetical protein